MKENNRQTDQLESGWTGWDPTQTGGYKDVLKPKITFSEILAALPENYTKGKLKEIVAYKNLMKVIAEAMPSSDLEKRILGHLTSICAETNRELTLRRALDYIGHELEEGVITVMRAPGKAYSAGEHVGYKMRGGMIKVVARARSIGPALGGTIWADHADRIHPGEANLYLGNEVDNRHVNLQSYFYQQRCGRKDLDALLQEADDYDWSGVEDIIIDESEKLRSFQKIVEHSRIALDGKILEFDCGPVSIGESPKYTDVIAMDSDPRNIKALRQKGIKAVIGRMDKTEIEDGSFDYVVAFHPQIAIDWKLMDPKWNEYKPNVDYINNVIRRAIEIAGKKVVIISAAISVIVPIPSKEKLETIRRSPVGTPEFYCCLIYDVNR